MTDRERYALLALEECAIHPLARVRFDYGDIDELAESIRTMGQVQPGRAVMGTTSSETPKGVRYLVYIGCRRFLACRKAGVKVFKALVVDEIDDGRMQRELLTENVKRSSLSVLEELNLLANYSKSSYSLDELAKDLGFAPRFVRARVRLAVLVQDKGLIETLYKIERASGYRFTNTHVEKITAFQEEKWLPLAIQAAELNWKADNIEDLGKEFTVESLVGSLPEWGRRFLASPAPVGAHRGEDQRDKNSDSSNSINQSQASPDSERPGEASDERHESPDDSFHPSRYQTITNLAQFVICPRCGSETVIELPRLPEVTLLRPGRVQTGTMVVPVGKEPVALQAAFGFVKCSNEGCGRILLLAFDQSDDGLVLAGRKDLLSLVGKGLEPADGGRGALLWDGKDEAWLKSQSNAARESVYQGYDEQTRRWVIPVTLGKQAAARMPQ